MVVKTETCSFSGLRIYPGHGIFFVRGDAKGFKFINRKTKSLFTQRLNPRKLAWTMMYRRMHKKGTLEDSQKKKTRKVHKAATKAVVGASLELIKQKRNQKPEVRAAAREAALREVKERAKAKQAAKKESKPKAAPIKAAPPKQSKVRRPPRCQLIRTTPPHTGPQARTLSMQGSPLRCARLFSLLHRLRRSRPTSRAPRACGDRCTLLSSSKAFPVVAG